MCLNIATCFHLHITSHFFLSNHNVANYWKSRKVLLLNKMGLVDYATISYGEKLLRITEQLSLEGIFEGHLVQPHAQAETPRTGCLGQCLVGF